MQIDYLKISYKKNVHICCTNFVKKKWNKICMKPLIGGKHMENKYFPRILMFEMASFLCHLVLCLPGPLKLTLFY
jgi:hypothetical protein